jgi:hypothetical protein
VASPRPERPDIDPSYGIGDPQYPFTPIAWNDVTHRLSESRNYWIVTTRPSGRAHSVPVWGVWTDNAFWFFTNTDSLTGRNLQRIPDAEVHLESGDDVVMLFGRFQTVRASEVVLAEYQAKYGMDDFGDPDNPLPARRLNLAKVIAWRERDFPNSATRWRF